MNNLSNDPPTKVIQDAIKKSKQLSILLLKLQPDSINLPSKKVCSSQIEGAEAKILRLKISSALFSIALDHHVALILLLEKSMYSSAFALLRLIADSTLRGCWAAHISSDKHLDDFITGRYDPKHNSVIKKLQEKSIFTPSLSLIYNNIWPITSNFTHSGSLQVQRWIGVDIISPQHTEAEILEIINLADFLAYTALTNLLDFLGVFPDNSQELKNHFLNFHQK